MNPEAELPMQYVAKRILKMNLEINAEDHLVGHYATLGSLKSDFRNYNLFNLVASLVKGNNVLDIGCGAAFLLDLIKKKGKNVIGIEPSSGMRALAAKVNPEVRVLSGMAEDIDSLIKEPVDSVLMIDVLEHIEKDIEQVKKVRSILKPEGEFIIVVPSHQFLYGKRDKQMGHYRRYSKKNLQEILVKNGFKVEYLRYWNALGFFPYLIYEKVLKKPLNTKLRQDIKLGILATIIQRLLNHWFGYVEDNINFGFGLSLIVVARKNI